MADVSERIVTVFGGTGFLGRRIVRHALDNGFRVRIAARRPERALTSSDLDRQRIEPVSADIRSEASICAALLGAYGAVNAVSLYVERGSDTFRAVHVEAAERLARQAREAGVERFVHVSGIGADPASRSPYIRSRGEGEQAVRAAFPAAVIVRPAVMFAPDDAFVSVIARLLRWFPVYPLFGDGRTPLQPVHVEDVAQAIVRVLLPGPRESIYECAGPRVYTYEELLRIIAREAGLRRLLLPVPFALWRAGALLAEVLPRPPITRNQVELMEVPGTASGAFAGFRELRISPRPLEQELPRILRGR